MLYCALRWSRIEFALIGSCHLVASVSALQAATVAWLNLAVVAAVLASFGLYLRDRFQTFYSRSRHGLLPLRPRLALAPEFARIDYRGRAHETAPPGVTYLSEFLLVLSLRAAPDLGSAPPIRLVLWPDSLSRSDQRHLRRYLRFQLPVKLTRD